MSSAACDQCETSDVLFVNTGLLGEANGSPKTAIGPAVLSQLEVRSGEGSKRCGEAQTVVRFL